MLIGTSWRFSARLRAVTMTSSRVVSADAVAAIAGMTCIPTGTDNAAVMARASFVREWGGMAAAFLRDHLMAERAAILRKASSPFFRFLACTVARVLYS